LFFTISEVIAPLLLRTPGKFTDALHCTALKAIPGVEIPIASGLHGELGKGDCGLLEK
jgi:hypothetical protein